VRVASDGASAAAGTTGWPGSTKEEGSAVAEQAAQQYRSAGRAEEASGWAVGFILFAAIMMIMAGCFQAFAGLVALFENEFYVATRNYLFEFDATTWGWSIWWSGSWWPWPGSRSWPAAPGAGSSASPWPC
jgi:hypothetical protein